VGPNDESTGRPRTPEEIAEHNARLLAEAEKPILFPWEEGFDPFGKTPTGRTARAQPFNQPRISQQEIDADLRVFDEAEKRMRRRA